MVVFLIPEIVFTGRNEASDEKEKMEWMDRSVIVRLPAGRLLLRAGDRQRVRDYLPQFRLCPQRCAVDPDPDYFQRAGFSSFFHLTSLCWHLANVCLVYRFFIMLLSKSNVYIEYNIRIIAFFTALLWGIHPVNVESVAWLSASKVLIYTFFFCCLYFVI